MPTSNGYQTGRAMQQPSTLQKKKYKKINCIFELKYQDKTTSV